MHIRLATPKDIEKIWQLRLETSHLLKQRNIDQWQQENPSLETITTDIANKEFFVAVKNSEIVGMIALKSGTDKSYNHIFEGAWNKEDSYLTIHRLGIKRNQLGTNLARKLLIFVEQRAKQLTINYLRIDTHKTNKYAIKLFNNFGYQYCGKVILIDEQGDKNRLVFDKIL